MRIADVEERPRGLLSGRPWMVVLRSGRVSGCGKGEAVRAGGGDCLGGSWGGVCCSCVGLQVFPRLGLEEGWWRRGWRGSAELEGRGCARE